MAEPEKPTKPKVALRRGATARGIAAELMMLLETVTADGTITDAEAGELQVWLEANRDSDLPAIDFLRTTLERILADGRITAEERKALQRAVERVLPSELREKARGRRVATELLGKAKEREEKAAVRARATEEREKNRRVYSANFMVAGVVYEGRSETVDQYLRSGQNVFLARDSSNQYDSNAIEIRLREGYQIGYVPREVAGTMAHFLDRGFKQRAHCTKVLNGRRAPIPVVRADIYRPDATIGGAIGNSDVPALRRAPLPSFTPPSRKDETRSSAPAASCAGCLVSLCGGLLLALLVALFSC